MPLADVCSILYFSLYFFLASRLVESSCQVRLGGAIAASGKFATYGQNCVQGWTLWAEKLNSRGGFRLPGKNCTVHLDLRDDDSSASKSAQILEDMLDPTSQSFANLDFVIGPASSGITAGNAVVAENYKRIIFSHGASETLYNRNNSYIFSSLAPGGQYMTYALKLLHARGVRTLVFAHETKSFSRSVCAGANNTATALGMEVLGYFEYAPGTANFASLLFEIKILKPEVYVGCGHLDDITYLIGQANVLGVNTKAMLVTHASDERIIGNVGVPHSHGLLSPTQWDKSLTYEDDDGFFGSSDNFYDDYESRFGMEPSYQAAYSAAMAYALQKAIEQAGSIATEQVRAKLCSLNVNSFYGLLRFNCDEDPSGLKGIMPSRSCAITQVQNGSIVVVAPTSKPSSLVYPVPSWSAKSLLLYPCSVGYEENGVTASGTTICDACPIGQFRDTSILSCVPCGVGKFTDVLGTATCRSCPATRTPNKTSGSTICVACFAGNYCPEGAPEPLQCPQGSFCSAASVLPSPCPEGTHRNETGASNVSQCLPCAPGRHTAKVGTIECSLCPRGLYSSESGQETCQQCPLGTYQDIEGSTNCKPCMATFVTPFRAAESSEACVCPESFFLNRADNICVPCDFSEGVVCLGGDSIPFVKEGFHAELIGDPNLELGSPSAFSSMYVWECPTPAHNFCPGRDVLKKANQTNEIMMAGCHANCMNHLRFPGECPPNHHGNVCALCADGFELIDGICQECSTDSLGLVFGIGIVVGILTALLIYSFCGKPVPKCHVAKLLLFNVCQQGIQFLQYVLLLASFSYDGPQTFRSLSRMFSFLLLDIPFVRLDCVMNSDILGQYAARASLPVLIVIIFFTNWIVSHALHVLTGHWLPHLTFDQTYNVCALVLTSLHVALCKVAVTCFECHTQVAAPDTMLRYPSVLCGSPEQEQMMPFGWSAIVVYVVGMLAFIVYISTIAPRLYQRDAVFRLRYCFLFAKWRSNRWYWGAVYMVRNALIVLMVFCFPRSPFHQACMMAIFMAWSMVWQVYYQPWRNKTSNTSDTFFSFALIIVILFSFGCIKQDGLEQAHTTNVILGVVLLAVLSSSMCLILYGLWLRVHLDHVAKMRNEGVTLLALRFEDLRGFLHSTGFDEFQQLLADLSDFELSDLSYALCHLRVPHCTLNRGGTGITTGNAGEYKLCSLTLPDVVRLTRASLLRRMDTFSRAATTTLEEKEVPTVPSFHHLSTTSTSLESLHSQASSTSPEILFGSSSADAPSQNEHSSFDEAKFEADGLTLGITEEGRCSLPSVGTLPAIMPTFHVMHLLPEQGEEEFPHVEKKEEELPNAEEQDEEELTHAEKKEEELPTAEEEDDECWYV